MCKVRHNGEERRIYILKVCILVGGWRLEVGGWKLEVGGWRFDEAVM